MSGENFYINEKFSRRIWKKIRATDVPIITQERYDDLKNVVDNVNKDLRSKVYMPSIGHGYLGVAKGVGVTRFVPIISDVDMAIYYHICFSIAGKILKKRPRIFGGYHLIPENLKITSSSEKDSLGFGQNYYSNPFSSTLWLKEWREYTKLVAALSKDKSIGNYVIKTDLANFYDSIEIPRLIRNLRHDAHDCEEIIEILEIFLSYWNRRIVGYQPSTKGIPQEIISDASRILSHYYLDNFDEKFSSYCEYEGLVNVRWADDILIFGNSKKKLEEAVHHASRILMTIGLNLNSGKTSMFLRKDFAKYRGVNVLGAIDKKNPKEFRTELKSALKWGESNEMRIDTIFRAAIGFVNNLGPKAQIYEKNFILETALSKAELLLSLNPRQYYILINASEEPIVFFKYILRAVISVPYAAPRASFLNMIRKNSALLTEKGISKTIQRNAVNKIYSESGSSDLIKDWCVPSVINILK